MLSESEELSVIYVTCGNCLTLFIKKVGVMFSVEFRYRARKIYKSVKQIVELVSNVLLFLAFFSQLF